MEKLLSQLPRPSRYLGIEEGAVHKDPALVSLRIALAFPDTYDVGMSYLGQKIIYSIINDNERWWAERVMTPEKEAGDILRAHNAPLATLESFTPLAAMHCIGFSITHELCYTNVLYMLDLAGIPLRATDRGDSLEQWPLILLGGGALLSAEPLAPFADLMLLGDGEEALPELLELLETARSRKVSKQEFLQQASRITGIYVPSFFAEDAQACLHALSPDYTSVQRRVAANLDSVSYPIKQVVPIGAVHNRLALEIAKGCTRGCRFCHAGMVYRPVRERSLDNLEHLLHECLEHTGFDEVSFLSLSTGDFSALKTLCNATLDQCAREQVALSLPSLRVGSIDDEIIGKMAGIRRTGATLAPEAGSQRLRDVINKGITEEELILHVQKLLEHGWQQVKLYFMIGLPTETDADLEAITELCCKVRDAAGPGGPRLMVTAALSPFVPKPFTPFQWVAQIPLKEIERRIQLVRQSMKGKKCLQMRWHEPSVSYLEGILSRGDRRLADVVEKAYHKGALFCSWMDHFTLTPWLEALEECGLEPEKFTGERPLDAVLPWAHLKTGVSDDFLKKEWERALQEKTTADCRYHVCRNCGVCDRADIPSLLRENNLPPLTNKLNLPQRDQNAHQPRRDEQGRIFYPRTKKEPPRIDPALTVKAGHFRIWHTKEEKSRYLSQLELQALLERAMRRASLPLAFSQGFHPLPLLSFGRALPVGVSSRAEWFSITLRTPLTALDIREKLSQRLPAGMRIVDVVPVENNMRTRQSLREDFDFRLLSEDAHRQEVFRQQWEHFLHLQERVWTHVTKKGERQMDIRPFFSNISIHESNVTFTADWEERYISPLALSFAVLGEAPSAHYELIKTAQHF